MSEAPLWYWIVVTILFIGLLIVSIYAAGLQRQQISSTKRKELRDESIDALTIAIGTLENKSLHWSLNQKTRGQLEEITEDLKLIRIYIEEHVL